MKRLVLLFLSLVLLFSSCTYKEEVSSKKDKEKVFVLNKDDAVSLKSSFVDARNISEEYFLKICDGYYSKDDIKLKIDGVSKVLSCEIDSSPVFNGNKVYFSYCFKFENSSSDEIFIKPLGKVFLKEGEKTLKSTDYSFFSYCVSLKGFSSDSLIVSDTLSPYTLIKSGTYKR